MKSLFLKTLAVCGGAVIGITISIVISSSLAAWGG